MLQKLLQLAKEEGGKAFVMNESTGEVFCVMPLEVYREMKRGAVAEPARMVESAEDIGSLSEEELLRKINREIATWRDQQKDKAEIILPTREDRAGVPEVKNIVKDFPQTTPIAKAPILETEEEFFLEMA